MARDMTEYEKKVKAAMANKGIPTYTALAELLNVSVSYIYDTVVGNRKAVDLRQKINDYLGITGE